MGSFCRATTNHPISVTLHLVSATLSSLLDFSRLAVSHSFVRSGLFALSILWCIGCPGLMLLVVAAETTGQSPAVWDGADIPLSKTRHMTKCQFFYGGREEGGTLVEQQSNPPQVTLNVFLFYWEAKDLIDEPGEIGRGPGQATSMVMIPVIMVMTGNIEEDRMLG